VLQVKEMGVGRKLVRCWMEVKVDDVQGSRRGNTQEPRDRKPRATLLSVNEPTNKNRCSVHLLSIHSHHMTILHQRHSSSRIPATKVRHLNNVFLASLSTVMQGTIDSSSSDTTLKLSGYLQLAVSG
jgi:hypothetical protein